MKYDLVKYASGWQINQLAWRVEAAADANVCLLGMSATPTASANGIATDRASCSTASGGLPPASHCIAIVQVL